MDIEGYAVAQVLSVLSQTDQLVANIEIRDKKPIWDGDILFYSDTQHHPNESLKKKIPIQVKGEIQKKSGRKAVTYPIRVCDLRQFKQTGGAIFFLVYIIQGKHGVRSKIYYKKLLPVSIMESIRLHPNQNEISFEFNEFPDSNKKIIMFFNDLCSDIDKQLTIASRSSVPTLEELQAAGIKTNERKINFTAMKGESPWTHFFTDSTFLYVEDPLGQSIPIKELPPSQEVRVKFPIPVGIENEKIYDSYSVLSTKNETREFYGKSLTIILNHQKKTSKITFSPKGGISSQITDTYFFIRLLECKTFNIGKMPRAIASQDVKSDDIEKLKMRYGLLCDISNGLKSIGASDDIDPDSLPKDERNNFDVIVNAFVHHQNVCLSPPISSGFIHRLKIGHQDILVMGIPLAKHGMYKLHNFCKANLKPSVNVDGKSRRICQFLLLEKEDWINATNIDYDFVLETIRTELGITPEYNFEINQLVLIMLLAYDVQKVKNKKLLDLIVKITDMLQKIPNKPKETMHIYKLNHLQAIKRQRGLFEQDKVFLNNLLLSDAELPIRVGAYILLEQFSEASLLYEKLEHDQKMAIINYPIANLWQDHP